MATLILNRTQARSIYSAMSAMYDVGGTLTQVMLPGDGTDRVVAVTDHGAYGVRVATPTRHEHYFDWDAFRDVYAIAE